MLKLRVLILFVFCSGIQSLSSHTELERLLRNVDGGSDLSSRRVADVLRDLLQSQVDSDEKYKDSSCSCQKNTCACCVHLEWDRVGLNNTVCTNFSYLPDDYGISLTVSVDGKVIYNKTVSARNPPNLCAGIPDFEKYASLCIKFSDLSINKKTFSGCVSVLAQLEGVEVYNIKLGCFKVPIISNKDIAMDTAKFMNIDENGDYQVETNKELNDMTLRFKPRN